MALQPVRCEIHGKPLYYWALNDRTKSPRGSVEKRETGARERNQAFRHSRRFDPQT